MAKLAVSVNCMTPFGFLNVKKCVELIKVHEKSALSINIIHKMLKNENPIIYGDGEQKRCFSFVKDCISPLYKMMISAKANKQIINIGPDEELSLIHI